MTRFEQLRWANDQQHIASRFHDYQRIMDHWRHVLPVPLLEVDYEETVADLEGVARKLVAWCGLEWEPACLQFHQTPSREDGQLGSSPAAGLRSPSVERWRHYEGPWPALCRSRRIAGMKILEKLAIAIRHHQGGRLQAAAEIYRDILRVEPDQADAVHLLGLVAYQSGEVEEAISCYRRALELRPDLAEAYGNLGNARCRPKRRWIKRSPVTAAPWS